MLKLACSEEILGQGMVLFFQNQSTQEFILAVDGLDNEKLVSWHGIREGMVGFPTCINHLDMWLNSNYHHNELEGFAAYKEETLDEWDYKEREILQKFASWQREAVFGRISVNGDILQFINHSGDIKSSRNVVEHLLHKGFIDETTKLFINNTDLGYVGNFLRAKGEEKVLISAILIQAAQHDSELLELAVKYQEISAVVKAATDAAKNASEAAMAAKEADSEAAEALRLKANQAKVTAAEVKASAEPQLDAIRSPAMNMIYDDHVGVMVNNIKKFSSYKHGEDQSTIEYFLTPALMRVTNTFLGSYNPSKGQINTYIGYSTGEIVKNIIRDEKAQKSKFPLASPNVVGGDQYEGSEGSELDPVSNATETYSGSGGAVDPKYQQIFKEYGTQIAQHLSPDDLSILNEYFLNGRTLDSIGQEKGLTRQRIQQKLKIITERLRGLFGKSSEPEGIVEQGSKKIILSLPESQ